MKKNLIAFFSLALFCVNAQNFLYQSEIEPVSKDGFYRIPLSPLTKQYMKADFSDVRIFNQKSQQVPYVLISEPQLRSSTEFETYPIVSQKHFNNYSEIIIENPGKQALNNMAFNINNSDAHKYCAVEGSDDKKQWYSVSTMQELSLAYNNDYTNCYKCIYFPKVDYRFIRLMVEDWQSQPLKINSAGNFKNSVMPGQLKAVPFVQSRKEIAAHKTTLIHLDFKQMQQIHRIDFTISEPKHFLRSAQILVTRHRQNKRQTETYREVLRQFELNSGKSLMLDFEGLNEKEIDIEIENKDNVPLTIDSIKCWQLATWLVCELKANTPYLLKCGDKSLHHPEYDLVNFITTTPHVLPQTLVKKMITVPVSSVNIAPKTKAFYEEKSFIWICIAIGSFVLFWFSRSLLKDMKREKQE